MAWDSKSNKRCNILIHAIQDLSLAKSLEQIQDVVKKTARKISGADGATFVIKENDQCFYVDEDAISPLWKGKRFPLDDCISGWVMLNRQSAVIEDIYKDIRIPSDIYKPTFVKSLAMVPVRKKQPIAAIGIYWAKKYKATPEEIEIIQSLADSTAIALENVKTLSVLNNKIEELNQENLAKKKALKDLSIARKHADSIQQSFEQIYDYSNTGIALSDQNGKIIEANTRFIDMLGYTKEEILSMNFADFTHAEDAEKEIALFHEILAKKRDDYRLEKRFITKDGSTLWVDLSVACTRKTDGAADTFFGMAIDISKQKQAQQILLENEEKYRALFNQSMDGIYIHDFTGKILDVNPAACEQSGYTYEELTNMTIFDAHPLNSTNPSREEALKIWKAKDFGQPSFFLVDHQRKDGTVYPVEIAASRVEYGGKRLLLSLVRDITERQRSQQELYDSYALLNNLTAQVPGVVYQYRLYPDGSSAFPFSSPGMYTIYEVTPEEVREDASPVFTRIHPDDYDYIVETINESAKNQTTYESEFRVILPKQGLRWRYCHAQPELLEDGSTLWHGIIMDITERKNNQQELNSQKERLTNILEGTNVGTWEWNVQTGETVYNDKWAGIIGYTLEELSPLSVDTWTKYVHPEDLKKSNVLLQKHFRGELDYYHFESRMKHKNGDWIWVLDRGKVVSWTDDGKPLWMYGTHQEITKQKKIEEEIIRQNQECEALNEELRQTNEELFESQNIIRESEEKFRSLFENQSVVQFIIDPETLRIVEANEAASNYYGWTKDELQSMQIGDINMLDKEMLKIKMEEAKSTRNFHFEFKHRKKDGTIVDIEVFSSKVPILGKEYLHSIIYDITEKKKNEHLISLLGHSVEQSPVSVLITNKNGKIEYINKAFTKISGYTADDVIGKTPDMLNSGKMPDKTYEELWETILSGKTWTGELLNKNKVGELYWISTVISSIKNKEGEITHFVSVREDVTEKKKMIKELITAKEKAEESDRLKTVFLNNMSHEVRTPMNGIMGFSGFLAKPDITPEKRQYYANIVSNSCNQLLHIIDEILEISQLETKQVKPEIVEFYLNDLLMELFSIYDLRAKERKIPLYLKKELPDANSMIRTDKSKLIKILGNLLENSLKFTNDGFIEFGYYLESGKTILFVKDTGIGIGTESFETIFQRFVQEENTSSRNFGGLGIGLSIAKENVELMGGEITLESEKGKGSTFYVSFPFLPVQTVDEHLSDGLDNSETEKNHTINILVAEDEEVNYLYIEALFEEQSDSRFRIIHAKNGQEAVDMCFGNNSIDLVLMDIKMPLMNGHEATVKIKAKFPDLPIIAQTAYSTEADKQLALKHGCDDFISKPIDKKELLKLLYKYLNSDR